MATRKVFECFLLIFLAGKVSAFLKQNRKNNVYEYKQQIAPKLLLSEYIQAGNIEEGRKLSLVTGLEPNIISYSGYLTVDEQCGSNLFFWFFPSQNDIENDPLTLWLNGGPSSSSLFGLLTENGPYSLTMDGELELREYSWNRNSSMIYFDSPVGTGYSYTENEYCYAQEETQVGRELMIALDQFLVLFPELQDNPFYITGESYAGKYIPALAYAIHTSENATNINLKGFAIGSGWVDPINQLNYSAYLYQLGLVDSNRRNYLAYYEEVIRNLTQAGAYYTADVLADYHLLVLFGVEAGYGSFYNYLYNMGEPTPDYAAFLSRREIREALHVGNSTFHDSTEVYDNLAYDIMQSVRPWLEELVEHYRVVLYSGQLDIIVAYPMTIDYINKMEWSGAQEYQTTKRINWYVDGELAGYSKTVKNFTEILVRNAGHMVPTDQPKWALDLYHRFIFNQPF